MGTISLRTLLLNNNNKNVNIFFYSDDLIIKNERDWNNYYAYFIKLAKKNYSVFPN